MPFWGLSSLVSWTSHFAQYDRHQIGQQINNRELAHHRVCLGCAGVSQIYECLLAFDQAVCNGNNADSRPTKECREFQDVYTGQMRMHSRCRTHFPEAE